MTTTTPIAADGLTAGLTAELAAALAEAEQLIASAPHVETEQDLQYATGALMELQANYMRTGSPQMNIQVSLCFQPGEQAGMPPADVKPYLMVRGLYVGDTASGEAAIAPLQALPGAVLAAM